jgi:putative hemolysin
MLSWCSTHSEMLALLALLLVLVAWLASAGTAFALLGRQAEPRLAEGGAVSRCAARLLRQPVPLHGSLLLAGTMLKVVVVTLAGWLLAEGLWGLGLLLAFLLLLVFGDVLPKVLALRHARMVALVSAWPVQMLVRVLTPLRWLLRGLVRLCLWTARQDPMRGVSSLGPEDIRRLIAESEAAGVASPLEREMAERVLALANIGGRAVMVPLANVRTVADDLTLKDAYEQAASLRFGGLPVCGPVAGDLWGYVPLGGAVRWRDEAVATDRPLSAWRATPGTPGSFLKSPVCAVPVFPASAKADFLLNELRRQGAPLAVLADAAGATVGVVFFDDLLAGVIGGMAPAAGPVKEPAT